MKKIIRPPSIKQETKKKSMSNSISSCGSKLSTHKYFDFILNNKNEDIFSTLHHTPTRFNSLSFVLKSAENCALFKMKLNENNNKK